MNDWINWTKKLKAISQTGIAYTKDGFDLERYHQVAEIVHGMISKLSEAPVSKIENFFVPDSGYATPKVDLRAGVIENNKILLVKERSDGKWTLPGGWADVNESPSQGVVREVLEESGFNIKVAKLIAVKDRSLHSYQPQYPSHIYKMFFLCDLISGEEKDNLEIQEIKFFKKSNIPILSESRVLKEDIEMVFDYFKNPDKSTLID